MINLEIKNVKDRLIEEVCDFRNSIDYDSEETPFDYEECEGFCIEFSKRYDFSEWSIDDMTVEFAEAYVNIYYSDIYANAERFQYWTEMLIAEDSIPERLYQLLQAGEFRAYYDTLAYNIDNIKTYVICNHIIDLISKSNDDEKTLTDKVGNLLDRANNKDIDGLWTEFNLI